MKHIDSDRLKGNIEDSSRSVLALTSQIQKISEICSAVVTALKSGGKVLTAGNGGSAAEALHMAEELVGRFRGDRVSLPGISLASDATVLTCISNDFGYDHVFSRQVEGLGTAGDVLVLFSTSGNAVNLKLALEMAHNKGMKVINLLGRDGGGIAGMADFEIIVEGSSTERIQEVHQVLVHLILDAVELAFA